MLPLLLAALLPTSALVQTTRLEGPALEAAIEELAKLVDENYVFPEHGRAMAERLRAQLWDGAYEVNDLGTLAARLTTDLRSINNDRHLAVSVLPARAAAAPDPAQRQREREEEARRTNHGFRKLEILDGNVGYLALDGFADAGPAGTPTAAGETAIAAMGYFANAEALIIDLRANGGGHPSMIQLLCSYFFAERTLLNTFEWRGRAEREEYWTTAEVPGKKRVDLPLFVLTSSSTFSAAEEFSYDLKCLKRATLVGARTGGGAHPGDFRAFGGVLSVFLPNGRAINPITQTNWEGTGVEPDVAVPAEQALERALALAREAVASRRRASAPR